MRIPSLPAYADLIKNAKSRFSRLTARKEFALETGWASNYEELFSGIFHTRLQEAQIPSLIFQSGRVLLAGEAGSGKTWLSRRLHRRLLRDGVIPLLIDLSEWRPSDYAEWAKWTSDDVLAASDFLLKRFVGKTVDALSLDKLPPDVRKVLIVDGLNEVARDTGDEIVELLDKFVTTQIGLSAFVTDRLARRATVNEQRWTLGRIMPLSTSIPDHTTSSSEAILRSPFFRAHLARHPAPKSRSAVLEQQFIDAGLTPPQISALSRRAFDAYATSRTRQFPHAWFAEEVGHDVMQALIQNGLIVIEERSKTLHFEHHIIHDYLAARHFSSLPGASWNANTLATLTFDGSSFDSVALVLENVNGERANQLLRVLYDWNLYAAGYALAFGGADANLDPETVTIILAVLAEKRFDRILATQRRASDSFSLILHPKSRAFRAAATFNEVRAIVDAAPMESARFALWKQLFLLPPTSELTEDVLRSVEDEDSVLGWTVANVAKRTKLSATGHEYLRACARNLNLPPTVRWRVVHVLGTIPGHATRDCLLQSLDLDPDRYVRYGAIRSLVEQASYSEENFRAETAEAIRRRAVELHQQTAVADELKRALLVDPSVTHGDWFSFVRTIVRAMFSSTEDVSGRDAWRACLLAAEDLYGRPHPPNP